MPQFDEQKDSIEQNNNPLQYAFHSEVITTLVLSLSDKAIAKYIYKFDNILVRFTESTYRNLIPKRTIVFATFNTTRK